MKYMLTLHEDAWYGDNSGDHRVTGYRVGGMPDGKTARIANFGAPHRSDWQIMRINADNTQTDWCGSYESAQAALAVLQKEYE